MAPHPRTIATDPVTQVVKRRTIRRRRRMNRSGAATGSIQTPTNFDNHSTANYQDLASHIRGVCDGFALANGITSQQAVAGLKKSLTW
jgi:hypothetical protein